MCETCACVIHTNLHTLSALVLSSYINVCAGVHVLHEALVYTAVNKHASMHYRGHPIHYQSVVSVYICKG